MTVCGLKQCHKAVPHPWNPGQKFDSLVFNLKDFQHCYCVLGKSESLNDKLRSILAQFEFKHRLHDWRDKGVDFTTYLYVPEIHPETDQVFCEREDEAHVLKVWTIPYVIHACWCNEYS